MSFSLQKSIASYSKLLEAETASSISASKTLLSSRGLIIRHSLVKNIGIKKVDRICYAQCGHNHEVFSDFIFKKYRVLIGLLNNRGN
jgi:hypothetical protein